MSEERGQVVLIGTNHTSGESSVHVRSAIRRHDPDVVAVELGPTRGSELRGEPPSRISVLRDIFRSAGPLGVAVNMGLNTLYNSVEMPADGGDMTVGARTAAARGTDVALIDEDILETIPALTDGIREDADAFREDAGEGWREVRELISAREWRGLARHLATAYARSAKDGIRQWLTLARIRLHIPSDADLSEVPPDLLRDTVVSIMDESVPGTMDALLHARDDHLAGRLHALRERGDTVVAVLGALHVPGVRDRLRNPERIPEDAIGQPNTRPPEDFNSLI